MPIEDALAATETCAALRESLHENADPVARDVVATGGVGDVDPIHVEILKRHETGARVESGLTDDPQHLQLSFAMQSSVTTCCITVKAGRPGVLRQVDGAGQRIDGGRFVVETTHSDDGNRAGIAVGRHVEHPAMGLLKDSRAAAGKVQVLFAGEPAVPGRMAPRAVANGAAQRRCRSDVAPAAQVEFDVGRSTRRVPGVVREIARGEGALVDGRGRVRQFVVAHVDDPIEAAEKDRTSVVTAGRGLPVRHQVARPAERRVAKASGQLQKRKPGPLIDGLHELPVIG